MNYIYSTIVYILILALPLESSSQDATPIFPDLYGQEALDSLIRGFKPVNILNYSKARDYLYGTVYIQNDTVECVYSGHKLHLPPNVDPSIHLFQNGSNDGINCEHTFPRSKGADEDNGNAYSDMHHLFPTRSLVNFGRENFPYSEIPDEESTHWYYENIVKSSMPSTNIEAYSERINGAFEPREEHKGNAARAMFYFYTMYKADADEADDDFFESQLETLCKWNKMDAVDEDELRRTSLIAEKQDGMGNPFVLDNSLVDRCYCSELTTSTGSVILPSQSSFKIYPNPALSNNAISIISDVEATFHIEFFTVGGNPINIESKTLTKGINRYDIPEIHDSHILYKIHDSANRSIVDSGLLFIL